MAPAGLGRVAIVGAGQVGTMIGMALRGASHDGFGLEEVALFDLDAGAVVASLGRGAGDRALSGMDEATAADTVVLAVPVRQIVELLDRFGEAFGAGSLVIDTGGTKGTVVEAIRRSVPSEVHAIGGHPVAGTERPGPYGADAARLRDATFVLTPARDDQVAVDRGRLLAAAVGSRPLVLDADTHDRVVALTSHLPHLLAFALRGMAATAQARFEPVAELAGTGFESAARLAASDPAMVGSFLAANAEEVRVAVRALQGLLDEALRAVDAGEERAAEWLGSLGLDRQPAADVR